ncbi:AsmA family protein [Chitinophaga rhizophila]|uniref:AsmA-like C-terminal region-containing protein n=1 Tax=Chitinophaga rhizophila TaxID=2866212 RepID=A0ABS7GHT7_9BACT|nr:AsmA-like C-terminal region-containing protein [Chitinophaga rhizophila]MBW8686881.1 AsmA-like C-terminal region-containing protein [Chitinophaga rhizophila]
MRKWLRITLIVSGGLLTLLVLLWLGIAWHIRHNKTAILQQISDRLNDRLHGGELLIKDMEPSLVRSFPNVSVALEGVSVKDSLWNTHHHPLLDVARIFVKVNTFSLLKKQLDIKQISLEEGVIYLFTDSTGYSNASMFKRNTKVKAEGKGVAADITRLQLKDVSLIIDNQQKNKLFSFDIGQLKGSMRNHDSGWVCNIQTAMRVGSLAFNTERGSFLKDKPLQTDLEITYNSTRKQLEIPQQALYIADQKITAGASFSFGELPKPFTVHIMAEQIPFRVAASLLTPKIQAKLDSITLDKPLDADCVLQGVMMPGEQPLVKVTWKTVDNHVTTKGMELQECSFTGRYTNEWIQGQPKGDENSVISLYGLTARVYSIPVKADTVDISNLRHPTLMGLFKADFPLTDLNGAQGEEGVFRFTGGTAKAALFYKGGITAGDTIIPYLKGQVRMEGGAMEYTPRNLQFSACNALLDFNGQDLFLQNISIRTQKSNLQMEGSVRNIARLYFSAPDKLQLDWKVRSEGIDLNEFRAFLGKRRQSKKASVAANRRKISRIASQLDVMLSSCIINVDVLLDKLTYGNFIAQQIKADLSMKENNVTLRQVALNHAGGSINLSGAMNQDGANNRFKINAGIRNVHIDQLFHAFNNFGMQSLSSKNLRGIFSATAAVSGNILDNGRMAPQSMYGTLSFDLRQGALVHFAPLEDIGNIAFRRRNLDNITFDNLKNTLTLQGNKIIVPPMQINSSALYMDVSGVYAMTKGTDMYITVPLRNPKRDEDIVDKEERKARRKKGIVINLHATDGEDGKVKIKLGSKKEKQPEEEL